MRHPASKSLSKEEVTKIYKLTYEIMKKENIADISLVIKPNVWMTAHILEFQRVNRTTKKISEQIQFGGYMLTGSIGPKSIYYISLYDPKHKVFEIFRPRQLMMATIVASVILEEIAHAVNSRREGKRINPHGPEFVLVFRELWNKYFISFQYALQSIYGSEGYLGEEVL